MPLNTTNLGYALKRLFPKARLLKLNFNDHPLYAELQKKNDVTAQGEDIAWPVRYEGSQGISADIAKAVANRSHQKGKRFLLTLADKFGSIEVSHKVIKLSRGDPGSFLRARESELEMALSAYADHVSTDIFRSGSGSIGRRGSISGTVITLKDKNDVNNFSEGMVIVANDTDNATTVRSGSMTVTGVDYDAGTVTIDADDVTGFANDDYLFVEGNPDKTVKGLAAWFPFTAPTSGDSFFGVDRSVNVTRLAGNRLDGTTMDPLTAMRRLLYKCEKNGPAPMNREGRRIYCSWSKFQEIVDSLDNKAEMVNVKVGDEVTVGWEAVKIAGRFGPATIIPDKSCPDDHAYCVALESLTLLSAGSVPDIIDEDGNSWRFDESDGNLSLNFVGYFQLACDAPAMNGVVKLAASTDLV